MSKKKSIRDSFGEALIKYGKTNKKIVAVSCDLKGATKLDKFFQKYPSRSIECGIAEANAVSIAAGISFLGFRPFLSSFGSFIVGKNIEIRTSIAYNLAPVVIVGTHGGLIGPDGATQAALQDISVMRTIPDMEVFQPCSDLDTKQIIKYLCRSSKPAYLRIARNEVQEFLPKNYKFKKGFSTKILEGKKLLVLSSGPMTRNCYDAIKNILDVSLINISSIKPLDEMHLIKSIKKFKKILTVEDHLIEGGLGGIVAEILSKFNLNVKLYRHGLNNEFINSDTPKNLEKYYKLDPAGIRKIIIKVLKDN